MGDKKRPIILRQLIPGRKTTLKDGTEEIGYDRIFYGRDEYEDKPSRIRRLVDGNWTEWESLPEDYQTPGFSKEWLDSLPEYQKEELVDIFLHMEELHYTKEAEKALEHSQHRQVMQDLARYTHNRRPSVRKQRLAELEESERKFKANLKAMEAANRFVAKEIRRMHSLPEPIFTLDLPDDVIRKLVLTKFDTVGKLLFGMMVNQECLVTAIMDDNQIDIKSAQWVYREQLLRAVGQEGYNLIGSKLMRFGYLQRDYFLSEFKNEHAYRVRWS